MTSTQKLTTSDLQHLAKLARIQLTTTEEQIYLPQLESVLDYIDILSEADTTHVEPSFQVTGLKNVTRDDSIISSLDQSEALSTATKTSHGFIVVPNTIKK